MAPVLGENVSQAPREKGKGSPDRIENNDLDETIPPCRECERHFFVRNSTFNVFDGVIVVISMFTFAADIVTDGLAASQYFVHGEPGWGCLTLGFTLVPCLIMQVFSVRWYLADEDMTGWRWLFHCCLLGPFERYVTVFETGLEARRSNDPFDFERLHHQQSDVCMLRLFESFLESAPQVVLQLYIMVATNDENLFTGISGTVSLFSLCWAVAAYSRAHRRVRVDKEGVSWPGAILQTLWRIGMISSRVVALVLFASAFKAYTFLVVGIHWVAMVLWVYFQHTDFCDTWLEERLFNAVIGTIYVFCFFNLKEGSTRYRISIFYLVIAVENVVLLLLWHRFGRLEEWYTSLGFTVVFGGFIIGVSTMILYYRFFHPRGAISFCGTLPEDKTKICLHGKPNPHHGNIDAEIFHRSRSPSPQSSPAGSDSSPLESPCSSQAGLPGEYSPIKTDLVTVERQTAPSVRSKSLGCLFTSEKEWPAGCASHENGRSLDNIADRTGQSQPVPSQNSQCTCSFQLYELSGFATDLVDRFDRRKETALAQSLLGDPSRMSLCSARSSTAAKFRTPCRTCLNFDGSRTDPGKSFPNRPGHSYSQPNTPMTTKSPRKAPNHIRANPEISASVPKRSKILDRPVHHDAHNARILTAQNQNLEIIQVPVDLQQMPDYIDSPQTTMSAYEVQKIYDQILKRDPSPRISKRQLKFDEGGDGRDKDSISSEKTGPPIIRTPQRMVNTRHQSHVDEDPQISKAGQVNPVSKSSSRRMSTESKAKDNPNHQLTITTECYNQDPHAAPKIHPIHLTTEVVTNKGDPNSLAFVKSPCSRPQSAFGVRRSEVKINDGTVHSLNKTLETPKHISPAKNENPDTLNLDVHHAGPEMKSKEASNCPSESKHITTNNTRTSLHHPPMTGSSETDKFHEAADPVTAAHSVSFKTSSLTGTVTRDSETRSSQTSVSSHMASGGLALAEDQIKRSENISKPREVFKDRIQSREVDTRTDTMKYSVGNERKYIAQATPSPNKVRPKRSENNLLSPIIIQKPKSVREAMSERPDIQSQISEHPAQSDAPAHLKSRHQPGSDPMSFGKLPQRAATTNSQTRYTSKEATAPHDALLPIPSMNGETNIPRPPGKENTPLTPLSARLALLNPSPSHNSPSSPSQKKPPRKSLGKIPANLVANKVAQFSN